MLMSINIFTNLLTLTFIHHSFIGGAASTPAPTVNPQPATQTPTVQPDIASDAEFGPKNKKHPIGFRKSPQEASVEEAVLKRSSVQGSRTVNVL